MQAIAGRFGGLRKVALLAAVHFAAIAALVAVAPGVAHAAGSCSTTAGVTTCTFGPTGAEDTFTVPDGVSSIHVVATGAPGAMSATSFAAGRGAEVSGDLTVTPGDTLYVEVGGAPTVGGNCFSGVACVGGFNGGGSTRSGGGGGGASDVREQARDQSGSLDSRLLVAAGGGGSGQGTFCRPNSTVFRGGAGGDAGSNGGNGEKCVTVSGGTGGGAGGQTDGGAGGSPDGQSGSLGQGGNGGVTSGGGGGGGLYGGGGGGSLVFGSFGSEPIQAPAGGGGGGSNLVPTGGNATIANSGPSITISYTGPNQAPVAADDAYSTDEDTPTDIDVLSNDNDANDDALSAAVVSGPSHGSVSLNSNGSFTYTPNANYNGGDSFTYKASDGRGGEDTATVNITVNAINDAPVADNQSVSTNEDTDKGITLTATDAENDPLTFSVVDTPTHGSFSGTGANLTYHPAANYNGSDSFTYKANDGSADSNVATVSITVNAVNDAPVAANDSAITDEDTPNDIAVLSNDTDDDGAADTLSVSSFTQPANGTVSENADGSLKYTPNADYNGADFFTYRATDGTEESNTAIVSIPVDPVNDAPSFTKGADQTVKEDAGPQSVSDWATAISAGPSDEASQQVSFVVTNDNNSLFTSTGKPAISSEGTLTYTPAPDASGSATVTVVLRDDGGPANGGVDTSAAQTFKITVSPVNDAPTVAVAAGGQCGTSGTSGQINLTVADVDNDVSALTLSATSSNQNLVPNSGLSVGGSGASRTLTVSAAAKRSGTATITVTVSDGDKTSTTQITVKVGTDSRDTLSGTTGADIIFGKNGNDAITGGDGNDLLCGGNGAGTMSGGAGDDTLDGANGNDVLRGDAGKDILRGGGGDDTLTGGTEADSFIGGAGTDKATDFKAAEGDTKDATVP